MAKIIHMLFDDAGWGDFPGRIENSNQLTPVIDALLASGTRFTRFYNASTVCSPSRAAWITGRMPQYSDIHWIDDPEGNYAAWIANEMPTAAKILRAMGYATGAFGKRHLGRPPQACLPPRLGYDRYFGTALSGIPNASYSGYQRYTDAFAIDDEPPHVQFTGHCDDIMMTKATEWLVSVADEDFYAEIWPCTTHQPMTTLEPEATTYFAGMSSFQKEYCSTLRRLDAQLGTLITALQGAGIWDETYLMLSSDNGPEQGAFGSAGGLRGLKTHLWEGGIRAPSIWLGPDVAAGATDATVRSSLDWLPTVLQIAGSTYTPATALPGSSLLSAAPSRVLYWEFNLANRAGRERAGGGGPGGPKAALRTSDDRKIHSNAAGTDGLEMYDITTDPAEATDLSVSEPIAFAEMKVLLNAFVPPAEDFDAHHITTPLVDSEAEAYGCVEGLDAFYGLEPAAPRGRVKLAAGESLTVTV